MTTHLTGTREEWLAARLELLEDGVVYHTYEAHLRGVEPFNVTYQLLDRTPRGRNEDGLPYPQAWIERRDEYERAGHGHCCGHAA